MSDSRTLLLSSYIFSFFLSVSLMRRLGARLDVVDKFGDCPLHHAAVFSSCHTINNDAISASPLSRSGQDDASCVAMMLRDMDGSRGALANVINADGETPLHLAAERGFLNVVDRLLDVGARIEVRNKRGETAMDKAATHNHEKCVASMRTRSGNSAMVSDHHQCYVHTKNQ